MKNDSISLAVTLVMTLLVVGVAAAAFFGIRAHTMAMELSERVTNLETALNAAGFEILDINERLGSQDGTSVSGTIVNSEGVEIDADELWRLIHEE